MTTWVYRHDQDLVVAEGPDARSFLQSLVSQDLDGVGVGAGALSLLLQPQGKLVAPFRALVTADDRVQLDADPGVGAALFDGLTRFMIRVKAQLTRSNTAMLRVRGPNCDVVVGSAELAVPPAVEHAHLLVDDIQTVRASWDASPGIDVLLPVDQVDAVLERLTASGAEVLDDDAYETARVEHGVLVFGRDIDDSTIAQEAELEVEAVSFTKGCFVGQELVCRIDSRGHVNRFVRRLVFADQQPGAEVGAEVQFDGKVVGAVTSAAPGAPIALANVRREVEPGATVDVSGRAATVHPRR